MPRTDLLALTPDDLAALTNRGTVKRALRELESGEATFKLTESDTGEVIVEWSDDARCVLPAGKTASDGRCNCPATTLCRHVIRSILAYQKQLAPAAGAGAAEGGDGTATAPVAPPQPPWDPGQISDEQLSAQFKKTTLSAAQARFEQGLLIEVIRFAKPTARFHQLACSLRFIVPGDVRYTHCDCAEAAPCSHVPLAVWAFRRLPAEQVSGMVSTQAQDLPVNAELLDACEALLGELIEQGLGGAAPTWKDRMLRLRDSCTEADLIWPAQALDDLAQQYERYTAHDARFSPQRVAELVGEWLIRADAIRSQTRAVPQLLIRGSSADRATDIGSARYIGLGCDIEQDRAGVSVTAYLQDSDSGSIVAVSRDFAEAKDGVEPPKDFHQLAAAPVFRGIALSALGAGQMLLKGGKRAPDHRLIVGRAKASVNPQNYAWDALRAPLLAEDFAEVRARLSALPPASLRPRYVAENLYVIPVAELIGARFDEASQSVEAVIRDHRQEMARVHHPFFWRGRDGCEVMMSALQSTLEGSQRLLYIAAHVQPAEGALLLHPLTLVFEKGSTRYAVQPWVDRHVAPTLAGEKAIPLPGSALSDSHGLAADRVSDYSSQILQTLGELALVGLRRADARVVRAWKELSRNGQALGYDQLTHPINALAAAIEAKLATPHWTADAARQSALQVAVLARLARDLKERGS